MLAFRLLLSLFDGVKVTLCFNMCKFFFEIILSNWCHSLSYSQIIQSNVNNMLNFDAEKSFLHIFYSNLLKKYFFGIFLGFANVFQNKNTQKTATSEAFH